ncbi:MAG TPA: hypothetical protein VEM13_13115 [Gemmatimonadales bacterium]|nr:hypothetical protein [Gemmatimonadales bacterium]
MTVVLGCAEPLAGPAASARNQVLDAELGLADPVLAGQLIAFVSARDGNFEIYVMKPDGSLQTRVTNNPAFDADPAWAITLTR